MGEHQNLPPQARQFLNIHIVAPPTLLEQEKIDLKNRYQNQYQNVPASASNARGASLERLNLQFTNSIGGIPTRSNLDIASGVLNQIANEHQQIAQEKVVLDQEKQALLKRVQEEFSSDPEGAGGSRPGNLQQAREQFAKRLGETNKPEDIGALRTDFAALEREHNDTLAEVKEQTEKARVELTKKLRDLVPAGGVAETIVPGASDDDVKPLIEEADRIAGLIGTATLGALGGLSGDVEKLSPALTKVKEAVSGRASQKQALIEEAGKITRPDGAEDDEWLGLQTAIGGVATAMDVTPLTPPVVEAGQNALEAAKSERLRIEGLAGDRKKEHDRIDNEGKTLIDPTCLEDQAQTLKVARDNLINALALPITAQRNSGANDALAKLHEAIDTVTKELVDLGGLENVTALCDKAGVDPKDYAKLETALGGRTATADLLKVFPPENLGPLLTTFGGGEAGAAKLRGAVTGFGDAAGVKKAMGDLGTDGEKKFAALLTTGGLDGTGAKKLMDDLGAPVLGTLMGSGNDPAPAIAIQTELGTNTKALRDLTAEGGFDGKPNALAALFTKGCGGDAEKFAELCTSFDQQSDRATLKGIIADGGLGDAPDCLGELFATGCDGKPGGLKTFGEFFKAPGATDGLKRMLNDGGLKGQKGVSGEGDVDPKCLARLMKDGAGPKPDPFAGTDQDDEKRRTDALAKLCGGMDKTACENMATMLKSGGLGTDPVVFGHLVGIGCDQGNPAKLSALGAEMIKDPANLAGLKNLLKEGGFGAKDPTDNDTNTDPKCLAEMMHLGCEGKPHEFAKLSKNLTKDDRERFADVLKNGGLGTRPEVLGNTYKFGCQQDPYNATQTDPGDVDSTKNLTVLQGFLTTFGKTSGSTATSNAPKLKEMLDSGGLDNGGDKSKGQAWLGKTMRDGFTDRNQPVAVPSGKTQDPSKLLDLHTTFNGHMPELKKMIVSMGTMPSSCGEDDEPGKALQNVHKSSGVAINQLRTQFFDTLSTRGGGINGTGGATAGIIIAGATPPPVATSLSTTDLIQTAASMEFDPLTNANPTLAGYDVNMQHVMDRHHRHGSARDPAGGNNNTGMFPKMVNKVPVPTTGPELTPFTEAMTAALIANAIPKSSTTNFMSVNGPPNNQNPPATNPPTQHSHMNQMHQRGYQNISATIPEGTFTVRLGFSCKTPPPGGHAANHGVKLGQFFLTGGTDFVLINDHDLGAIKTALGK